MSSFSFKTLQTDRFFVLNTVQTTLVSYKPMISKTFILESNDSAQALVLVGSRQKLDYPKD
jgi:hypothetical protein